MMKRLLYRLIFCIAILIAGGCTAGGIDDRSTTDVLNAASETLQRSLEVLNDTIVNPMNLE